MSFSQHFTMRPTTNQVPSRALVPWVPSIAGVLAIVQETHTTTKLFTPLQPSASDLANYDAAGVQVAETILLCIDVQVTVHVEIQVKVDVTLTLNTPAIQWATILQESVQEAERLIERFDVVEYVYGLEIM
ncbi:hypothetical protein FKP32DRAFT_1682167 [Trametes sanguinea]|nr:hypothetical protein FKP32DRAFT_1682167 [Trametes sanguinea]